MINSLVHNKISRTDMSFIQSIRLFHRVSIYITLLQFHRSKSSLWPCFLGNVAKYDYETVSRLQQKAVRLITKSSRYSYTDPIFEQIKFHKLDSTKKLKICKFIHSDYFINNFFYQTPRSDVHSYKTRFNSDIALATIRIIEVYIYTIICPMN